MVCCLENYSKLFEFLLDSWIDEALKGDQKVIKLNVFFRCIDLYIGTVNPR